VAIKINLASKPFTNRTLPWIITAVILLISVVAFLLIIRTSGEARSQAASIEAENQSLRQQEEVLRKKVEAVQGSLSVEQLADLKAAHALVDRKQFSWSRLFIDLENALPGDVRVTRIAVRDISTTAGETVAQLDLAVVAKSSSVVTDMISEMDRRGLFQANLQVQNLQKGRGETGTEYELFVLYRPAHGVGQSQDRAANNGPAIANGAVGELR